MSKELTTITNSMEKTMATQQSQTIDIESMYTKQDLLALRNQYAANLSDDQFRIYVMACNRLGLDPARKHIYGIIRGKKLSIETGIDGFRYIADRTNRYSPGNEEPIYKDGELIGAKVWVKKLVKNHMAEFYSIAFLSEYKPKVNDFMWKEKPFVMISKCAEAKALRRAFPNEFCGIYCSEEMEYANSKQEKTEQEIIVIASTISNAQMQHIKELVSFDIHIIKKIVDRFNVLKFSDLLASDFDTIIDYSAKLVISPLQLNNLVNIVSSSSDPQKLEEYILKSFSIEKLIELNQIQYKKIINTLKLKQQQKNGDQNETSQPRAENA